LIEGDSKKRTILLVTYDVKTLRRALSVVKHSLPEAVAKRRDISRRSALVAYHKKADQLNDLRRMPAVLRKVLRRKDETPSRRLALERAARRMLLGLPEQKLRRAIRRRFEKAMKSRVKSEVVFGMTGMSLPDLRQYLEGKFQPGMSWSNYGFRGWHIDHVKPLALFALGDAAAFHYSNLQPLWMKDNLKKSDTFAVVQKLDTV
jgi:hypothetical protein